MKPITTTGVQVTKTYILKPVPPAPKHIRDPRKWIPPGGLRGR